MAILHATVLQLAHEDIITISDLIEFEKPSIQQIMENYRRPGSRVSDHSHMTGAGATIPTPPSRFGAKS